MTATKPKSTGERSTTWSNKVIRTVDGQLVVRGVDVPASGLTWERLSLGKPIPRITRKGSTGEKQVLAAVTNRSKAFAIAKRAGLTEPRKVKPAKK